MNFNVDEHACLFPELINSRELEKDELRPLYMDFQATTPMVPICCSHPNYTPAM